MKLGAIIGGNEQRARKMKWQARISGRSAKRASKALRRWMLAVDLLSGVPRTMNEMPIAMARTPKP